MTAIDTEAVLELLREVGAGLCETFWQSAPVVEADAMRRAFQRIDGIAGAALRQELSARYPAIPWADGTLSEAHARAGEYWICDAIDGAAQFLRAIPNWCMSLTLMREGVPVFSAVYDAMHDEMFHALWGHGAWYNGKPMRVNGCADVQQAVVASAQAGFAAGGAGPVSLQLAYVACGRLDAFWQYGEDGYHCIGGALLIGEAGGVVTRADGQPYGLTSASIAAAPPGMHASMLRRLPAASA